MAWADGGRILAAVAVLAAGCVARGPVRPGDRGPFHFPADTFAFANELVREYAIDPVSGRTTWRTRDPRPSFTLHCGPMARAARQFFTSARFDPAAPGADLRTYERLVREVLATDPRRPPATRILIPGYPDLRTFSAAHPEMIQRALGGWWRSYFQRGNWRMIFPFGRSHQEATADRLRDALAADRPPVVHVLRYPRRTINHLVLVYAVEEHPAEIRFLAYDPNDSSRPFVLTWDRAAKTFAFEPTGYFRGGPVKAYEVYDGLFY